MFSQDPNVHCSQINTSSQMKSLQMQFPWCTVYMKDRFSLCTSQHSLSSSKSRTETVALGATQGTNILVMAGKGCHTQEYEHLAIKLYSIKKESKVDFVDVVLESRLRMSKGKCRKTLYFPLLERSETVTANFFKQIFFFHCIYSIFKNCSQTTTVAYKSCLKKKMS